MLMKIISVVKKIIFSSFLLYGYNLLVEPLGIMIPINLITISCISFLGIPALFSFILINVLIF